MKSSSSSSNLFPQVPTMNEMIDMWKKNKMNTFGIIYSWFLAKVFFLLLVFAVSNSCFFIIWSALLLLFKVASQLEVLPGAEFRVAFEEAMSYGGKVLLGDRPVQVSNPAMEAGYVLMKLRIYIINFWYCCFHAFGIMFKTEWSCILLFTCQYLVHTHLSLFWEI